MTMSLAVGPKLGKFKTECFCGLKLCIFRLGYYSCVQNKIGGKRSCVYWQEIYCVPYIYSVLRAHTHTKTVIPTRSLLGDAWLRTYSSLWVQNYKKHSTLESTGSINAKMLQMHSFHGWHAQIERTTVTESRSVTSFHMSFHDKIVMYLRPF